MANSTHRRRLVDERPDLPRHQSHAAAPVVADPELPTMTPATKVRADAKKTDQTLVNPELPTMAPVAKIRATAKRTGQILGGGRKGKARMGPVPKSTVRTQAARRAVQKARVHAAPVALDGYVRLELHAEGGRLSIVGIHEVAGPLKIPDAIIHGYVYEVLLGDRRVSLGSIPDVGRRRAFANADVPGPEGKHRYFPQAAFDFFVRIPKAELRPERLAQTHIVLYRVDAAPDRLSERPLARHAGVEAVEIARLPGIIRDELPPQVREQLERISGATEQNR